MPCRRVLTTCALLLCAAPVAAQSGDDGDLRPLEVAGVRRTYLLHLPPSREPAHPIPLLFVCHGAGGDAEGFALHTGLTGAPARGYAVVYPNGVNRRWNDGRGTRSTADDVGFVRVLLDSL